MIRRAQYEDFSLKMLPALSEPPADKTVVLQRWNTGWYPMRRARHRETRKNDEQKIEEEKETNIRAGRQHSKF